MPSRLRSNSGTKISFFAFQDIITSVTGILLLITLIMALHLNEEAPAPTALPPDPTSVQKQLIETQARNESMRRTIEAAATAPQIQSLEAKIEELKRQHAMLKSRLDRESKERPVVPDLGGMEQERQIQQNRERLQQMRNTAQETDARIRELVAQMKDQVVLIPERDNSGKRPVIIVLSATKITAERPGASTRTVLSGDGLDAQFKAALQSFDASKEYIVFYVRPSGIDLLMLCRKIAADANFTLGNDVLDESKELVIAPTP